MQNISVHPEGERSPRTEWEGEGGEAVSPDASWTIVLYGAGALRHAAQLPAARSISIGGGVTAQWRTLRQPQEDGTDGVWEGKRGWAVRVFGSSRREAHRVQKEGYNSGKANTRLEPRHGSKGGTAPAL